MWEYDWIFPRDISRWVIVQLVFTLLCKVWIYACGQSSLEKDESKDTTANIESVTDEKKTDGNTNDEVATDNKETSGEGAEGNEDVSGNDVETPDNKKEESTSKDPESTTSKKEESTSKEPTKTEPSKPKDDHVHSYTTKVVAASCTTAGYTLNSCKCGDQYKTDNVKATGHKYGAWKTTKEATAITKGKAERKCDSSNVYYFIYICNYVETVNNFV